MLDLRLLVLLLRLLMHLLLCTPPRALVLGLRLLTLALRLLLYTSPLLPLLLCSAAPLRTATALRLCVHGYGRWGHAAQRYTRVTRPPPQTRALLCKTGPHSPNRGANRRVNPRVNPSVNRRVNCRGAQQ